MRPLLMLTILLAVPLAGCLGDSEMDEPAPTGPVANATTATDGSSSEDGSVASPAGTDARGSVRVEVVDRELDPITGVTVAVAGRTASTDETGIATLTNVPAGTHTLAARKEGWREGVADVTVNENEETQARVKLLPAFLGPQVDQSQNQTYKAEYEFQGVFECSATYLIITGDCLTIVDFAAEEAGLDVRPGDATEEQNSYDFPLDRGWETVIIEQEWENAVIPVKMQLALEPTEFDTADHAPKYARVTGDSPLYIRLDKGVPHPTRDESVEGEAPKMPNPYGGEIVRSRSFVLGEAHNPGGTNFLGFGAAYGQRFQVFITVFYGEPAPEGYSYHDRDDGT